MLHTRILCVPPGAGSALLNKDPEHPLATYVPKAVELPPSRPCAKHSGEDPHQAWEAKEEGGGRQSGARLRFSPERRQAGIMLCEIRARNICILCLTYTEL